MSRRQQRATAPPPEKEAPSLDRKALRGMTGEEFARRLKATTEAPDKRFAFFVGAGCSVSSGVPAAASLVKDDWLHRLRELRAPQRKDLEQWAKETVPGYNPSNPAGSYGPVMHQLLLLQEERQREVERLCDGAGSPASATLSSQQWWRWTADALTSC